MTTEIAKNQNRYAIRRASGGENDHRNLNNSKSVRQSTSDAEKKGSRHRAKEVEATDQAGAEATG